MEMIKVKVRRSGGDLVEVDGIEFGVTLDKPRIFNASKALQGPRYAVTHKLSGGVVCYIKNLDKAEAIEGIQKTVDTYGLKCFVSVLENARRYKWGAQ